MQESIFQSLPPEQAHEAAPWNQTISMQCKFPLKIFVTIDNRMIYVHDSCDRFVAGGFCRATT